MLTKEDLSNIQQLVQSVVKEEIRPLKEDVKGLQKDVGLLQKDVRVLKKDMKQVKKNINIIIDHFDDADLKLDKRITRVEDHLGLAALA